MAKTTINNSKTASMPGARAMIGLMQSWLWCNDNHKLFFSKRPTGRQGEHYCFFLEIKSGKRGHGRYRHTGDGILVEFLRGEYIVAELSGMRKYDSTMVQLTNTKNDRDYHNWLAVPIPEKKGPRYFIE